MTVKMASGTMLHLFLVAVMLVSSANLKSSMLPLHESGKGWDAVVAECRQCQSQRCDGSVGYRGSPDDTGETTLDAMIING